MIRELTRKELDDALTLVWDVFLEFESVNYTEPGKQAFYNAIHTEEFLSELSAYGAFEDDRLIGIIATREEGSHIALFFVDGKYHKKGIGRSLWNTVLNNSNADVITVNASIYGSRIYKRLGFTQVDEPQEKDGIHFVPMSYDNK